MASADSPPQARSALPLALIVALAVALGIAVADALSGMVLAGVDAVIWTAAAISAALGALACITRANTGRWPCLAGAALCAGLALGFGELRSGLGEQQEGPVRLVGVVASAPRETASGADVLAGFAHGQASSVFELEVSAVERDGGARVPVRASVLVRVQELGPLPPRGSRVCVRGWYRPPGQARNPGGRASRGDGSVAVPYLAMVQKIGDQAPTLSQRVRSAADSALERSFPEWSTESWRALVKAMTTGVRMPALVVPGAQFRMAGMSHILAISGFNVAVLVSFGAGAVALLGAGIGARAVAALVISALFLLVTEPEVSVLRAGLGAGLAAIAGARGGRARGLGALGAVAVFTLLVDPASLFNAGFQLSYGVVLGLLTLAGPPAERWGARANSLLALVAPARLAGSETAQTLLGMFVGACVSSIVAFTVSTPIALCCGGFMSSYAAPISVFTMPAAALVTVGGVVAIALGQFWPAASTVAGSVSCGCAAFLAGVAECAADWPATCWWTGKPSLWWVALAACAVALAWRAREARTRRIAWCCVAVLAALVWFGAARPHAGAPPHGTLRVEMLDVGNGSCVVVRSRDSVLLYDAGTSSDDAAGSRRIVPAIAALGIRQIDAVIVSHASMEHYSALPEVVRAFDIRRVIVSQQLAQSVRPESRNSLATVVGWLAARGRSLETRTAGEELHVGSLVATVLAPDVGYAPARSGDASLVLRIRLESAERPSACAILTGGLRQEGCAALLRTLGGCTCALLELPAHGAWSAQAAQLVKALAPSAVAQSAGSSRTRKDRWVGTLAGLPSPLLRAVTAFHGAVRVEIAADGAVHAWQWVQSGWSALRNDGPVQQDHAPDP